MASTVNYPNVAALLHSIYNKDTVPCQIEEGLYLGSCGAARNKDGLKELNITHILTVAKLLKPTYPNEFKYKIIEVMDLKEVDLMQYFDECFNFIDEAKSFGGSVLVHCYAGVSRSVTIVLAYLMKRNGMSFTEALGHVRTKRPQAFPNCGFVFQLKKFEKTLQEKKMEEECGECSLVQN